MAQIARLNIDLVAKTAALTKGLTKAGKDIQKFGVSTKTIMAGLGASLAAAFSVRAIGTFIGKLNEAATAMDALTNTAERFGVTGQQLQVMRFAALEGSRMTPEQFDMALQRMIRRVSEAADGTGEARNAINELGLDAQRLERIGPYKAFAEIAEAMEDVTLKSDRIRLAFKFFDSEGAKLATTLANGDDSLKNAISDLREMGVLFDSDDEAAAKRWSHSANMAETAIDGLWVKLTTRLEPALRLVNEHFQGIMAATGAGAALNAAGAVGALADRFTEDGTPRNQAEWEAKKHAVTAANYYRKLEERQVQITKDYNDRRLRQEREFQDMLFAHLNADVMATDRPNVFMPMFEAIDGVRKLTTDLAPSGSAERGSQEAFQAMMRGFGDKEIEIEAKMLKELGGIHSEMKKKPTVELKAADLLGYDPYSL